MTKYDYYALILALCIAILILSNGCVSSKKAYNEEQNTNLVVKQKEMASDIAVLDYSIDTSKECAQTIAYDIVEYYPECDSQTHQQLVKTRKKVKVNTRKKTAGVTSLDTMRVKTNSTVLSKDSIANKSVASTKEREPNSTNLRWWWLIIALVVTTYIVYKIKK